MAGIPTQRLSPARFHVNINLGANIPITPTTTTTTTPPPTKSATTTRRTRHKTPHNIHPPPLSPYHNRPLPPPSALLPLRIPPPNSLLATTQHQTRTSLSIIKDALTRYQLPELSLSYNGGKDCLVLLILFLASLHPHPPASAGGLASIPAIYALPPDPFPDVEDFVRWSSEAYHLSIDKFTTDPPTSTLRDAFDHYLALNPTIRAIFVGTRRTDPHGARLTHFDPTDSGWPDFVRIHPVIDWHYAQIWTFIRHLDLRYCPLYDQGYTSLGGTTDTLPNPKLRTDGSDGEDEYRPAYELTEDLEERLGRN
ncbi:adenine nucleotide alpha hydrolases-like protein [Aspergillus campestris IBT 28561]|uniref:FAD synthase n=1 Tax=Aspergillus campestris (strain IBT 28561) TaxID=1392248 RepID=A0A2I1DHG2_ASPC2|nr:adenine nucleotide alpha hydrolases-like protein [Aspergillus campestris IBT 28561]PKY09313.1 adenine nucleotide alpha hydrolases-like protein [Aspergillus campestris IBT 28561]